MIKRINNSSFVIIACLAALVLATAFFSTGCLDLGGLIGWEEEEAKITELQKEKLGSDQERLLSIFGYPDEFIIVFDLDNEKTRIETWLYEDMESSYTFISGEYNSSDRVITDELLSDDFDINPEDFVYGMSPDEVNRLLGDEGIVEVDNDTNLKTITYGEGLIVCNFTADEALVSVLRARGIRSD